MTGELPRSRTLGTAFRPSSRAASLALALLMATSGPCPAHAAEAVQPGSHELEAITVAEPADYRMDHYNSPVPATLKGARVVEAAEVMAERQNGAGPLLIDVYPRAPKPPGLPAGTVWRSAKHLSIPGSYWLPNVGYGKLAPEPEAYFRHGLERLTGGDKSKPVVFFCLADCWMSWNAAKRAIEWGYTSVAWFPRGNDGWRDAGGELVHVEPERGPDGKAPE